MIVFDLPTCRGACPLNGESSGPRFMCLPHPMLSCFLLLIGFLTCLCDIDTMSVLPRFFAGLNAEPSPSEPCPELASGQDSCRNTKPPFEHYRVRFSLDGLLDFQGMHSAATQGDDQGLQPSVNFRKRPNYDNSKRSLMKIQRPRKQCQT